MAKKKTTASSTPDTVSSPASSSKSAAPRRRAPEKSAKASAPPADVANDRGATFVAVTIEAPTFEQIAEAAYLRYLNRGGGDGRDFDDWLEAERELTAR